MKTYFSSIFCATFVLLLLSSDSASQSTEPILMLNTEMHTGQIRAIDTDAANKYILTASYDKTAKLWDAESGALLHTFRVPIGKNQEGRLYAGALSPNGKTVALGGWSNFAEKGNDIYFFSTATGEMLHRISSLPNVIIDLEFSPDGTHLVAALGGSNGIRIFFESDGFVSPQHAYLVATRTDYGAASYNAAWSRDGRLAAVSDDGSLRLYDQQFNITHTQQNLAGSEPFSLAFSPDGSLLVVGYDDSPRIQVFDGRTLELRFEPDISGASTSNRHLFIVSFSHDGQYLIAGGTYRKTVNGTWWRHVRVWEHQGRGSYNDYPAAGSNVMDIKLLISDGFIYAGAYPDFGRMSLYGQNHMYKRAEANDYRARVKSHFTINSNGSVVGVTPVGEESLIFDANNRQYLPDSAYPHSSTLQPYSDRRAEITVTDWKETFEPKINSRTTDFLRARERSRSVSVALDGKSIVFGANWYLYGLDTQGQMQWEAPVQGVASAVNISGNGQVATAALGDGTIVWHRMSDGQRLLTLFLHPDGKRWVLWTPKGYYDAAPGAEDLIGWHVNNGSDRAADFYPIDRFFDTHYRPDIINEILRTNETDKQVLARLGQEQHQFSRPPVVRFTSPEPGSSTNQQTITLTAEITDRGTGIGEIRLMHNGSNISGDLRAFRMVSGDGESTTRTFEVPLLLGKNHFRLSAFNTDRVESNPAELTITYEGVARESDLYIIAVGVDQYQNPRYNLNYGRSDAEAFASIFEQEGSRIYNKVIVTRIYDGDANRANIQAAFARVQQIANPEDTFKFFYAGHGVVNEPSNPAERPDFFLALHDVTQLYGQERMLQERGISATELTEWVSKIEARRQMVIFDACQAGGAIDAFAFRGAAEERAIQQLARSTGVAIIASSESEQFATEFAQLGHGVFTYALLSGLRGEALMGGTTGSITVQQLIAYINQAVPDLTLQYRGQTQYPVSFSRGMDFPLMVRD